MNSGETMTAPDCINMQTLETLAGLMGEVFDQLIPSYIDSSDKCFEDGRSAIVQQDAEAAERLFHSLKSSSRNLGAEKLGDMAATLETAMREKQLDNVQPLFDDAEQMYQQVRKALLDFQVTR